MLKIHVKREHLLLLNLKMTSGLKPKTFTLSHLRDQPGECSGDIFLAQGISCQLPLMFSNKGVEKLHTLNNSYSMGKESPIQRLSYKLVDIPLFLYFTILFAIIEHTTLPFKFYVIAARMDIIIFHSEIGKNLMLDEFSPRRMHRSIPRVFLVAILGKWPYITAA